MDSFFRKADNTGTRKIAKDNIFKQFAMISAFLATMAGAITCKKTDVADYYAKFLNEDAL